MKNALRLTGGTASGRPIRTVDSPLVRPALAAVRKSLFDILGGHTPESNVLDLFAGTGSLGLESLSRGAPFCRFVENNRRCLDAIRANAHTLGFTDRCAVLSANVFRATDPLPDAPGGYRLVFICPPYRYFRESDFRARLSTLFASLAASDRIAPDALIVVEHPEEAPPAEIAASLRQTDDRTYGQTVIKIYRKIV